jgi:hypothetical protein
MDNGWKLCVGKDGVLIGTTLYSPKAPLVERSNEMPGRSALLLQINPSSEELTNDLVSDAEYPF